MAKERLAVAEMVMNLILGKTEGISRVDFFPQKKRFPFDQPYEQPFARATPESQGIPSGKLAALIEDLHASKQTDMHHLMVLRHGKVICECSFAPYQDGIWHVTHSMCKTITGMAIGMLVDEGLLSLDESVHRIFENKLNSLLKLFRSEVTVEQLLTMTSGVQFNESGVISGNDWLSAYLNAPVIERPGTVFHYNSLNTYVLSAIVQKKTGLRLDEYLKPRLFEPLGITKYFWETCPQGITKGGWGLFLTAEDMAKLGQLYLQHGSWNGRQIVPEHWVASSTAKHVETGGDTYGYGYQLWMEARPGSYEFNGMLGQNVIVYPDMDMVLVTNAANKELFQDCVMLNIIRAHFPLEYVPEEGPLAEDPVACRKLRRVCARMSRGAQADSCGGMEPEQTRICTGGEMSPCQTGIRAGSGMNLWRTEIRAGGWRKRGGASRRRARVPSKESLIRMLDGSCYELTQKNVGLFPLLMQVFHNNLTGGITRVAFSREADGFYVRFEENGSWHPLRVGFGGNMCRNELTLHDEPYLVAAGGEVAQDERGWPVLKLELAFLEEAARRSVHFFFHEDEVQLRWYESPGKRMILEGLGSVAEDMSGSLLFGMLKDRELMENLLHRLMEETIEPVVYGRKVIAAAEQSMPEQSTAEQDSAGEEEWNPEIDSAQGEEEGA